jgi:hypothetical protein
MVEVEGVVVDGVVVEGVDGAALGGVAVWAKAGPARSAARAVTVSIFVFMANSVL